MNDTYTLEQVIRYCGATGLISYIIGFIGAWVLKGPRR